MDERVFLLALAIVGGTLVLVVRTIAGAITGRRASRSDPAHLGERVEQQAVALEDVQNSLANQSAQLAELQERVDFAERLLAQPRERPPLGPGEDRG